MKQDNKFGTYRVESNRWDGWDYSQEGAYFLTICVEGRENIFGEVVNGEMNHSEFGAIVEEEWCKSADLRPTIVFDAFVVMPNHIHMIVALSPTESNLQVSVGEGNMAIRCTKSISSFVSQFKAIISKRINELRGTPGSRVFQRNYHDRVIRNTAEWERIAAYIEENPLHWEKDEMYLK